MNRDGDLHRERRRCRRTLDRGLSHWLINTRGTNRRREELRLQDLPNSPIKGMDIHNLKDSPRNNLPISEEEVIGARVRDREPKTDPQLRPMDGLDLHRERGGNLTTLLRKNRDHTTMAEAKPRMGVVVNTPTARDQNIRRRG